MTNTNMIHDAHVQTTKQHYIEQRERIQEVNYALLSQVVFTGLICEDFKKAYHGMYAIEAKFQQIIEDIIDGDWEPENNW